MGSDHRDFSPGWIQTLILQHHQEYSQCWRHYPAARNEAKGTWALASSAIHSFLLQMTNIFDHLPALTAPKPADFRSELDCYLNTDVGDVTDMIQWWYEHRDSYPHLSRMALDYLTIPGMYHSRSDCRCPNMPDSNLNRCRTSIYLRLPPSLPRPIASCCSVHSHCSLPWDMEWAQPSQEWWCTEGQWTCWAHGGRWVRGWLGQHQDWLVATSINFVHLCPMKISVPMGM